MKNDSIAEARSGQTQSGNSQAAHVVTAELVVSNYDRTSVFLASAIMIVGFFVAVLFSIWVSWDSAHASVAPPPRPWPHPPTRLDPNEAELFLLDSNQDDLVDPGEELPEIRKPELAKSLEAVKRIASQVLAQRNLGMAQQMGSGDGGARMGRIVGPRNPGGEAARWRVQFEAEDIEAYSRQLDFFDLEIAVVQKFTNRIQRLSDLSGTLKISASNRTAERKTLRFEHRQARLRRWDEQLAEQAGADTATGITCLFYPEATREIMRRIEAEYAAKLKKTPDEIFSTVFSLVPVEGGYEFRVKEMKF